MTDLFPKFLEAAAYIRDQHEWGKVVSPFVLSKLLRTKKKQAEKIRKDVGAKAAYNIGPESLPSKKDFARMRDGAWKAVTGQGYNRYIHNKYRVVMGKIASEYGTEAIEAFWKLHYAKKTGNLLLRNDKVWKGLADRWRESPNATVATIIIIGGTHSLDNPEIFRETKNETSKGEWKWLMSRPLYQILQMPDNGFAVKRAARLRIRPAFVKNPQVRKILGVSADLTLILANEMRRLDTPICRWFPFGEVGFNNRRGWNCREFDMCLDFCRHNEVNSTTFRGLLRSAQEWHENISPDKNRPNVSLENNLQEWEKDGFIFTPLKETHEIVQEGRDQHHCVGMGAQECVAGRMAVIKITGKERATLGLRARGEGWGFSQCYKACNEHVSDELAQIAHEYVNWANANCLETILTEVTLETEAA